MAPRDYLYGLSLLLVAGKLFAGTPISWAWAIAPACVHSALVLLNSLIVYLHVRHHIALAKKQAKAEGFKVPTVGDEQKQARNPWYN